jgi:hypothetical protein
MADAPQALRQVRNILQPNGTFILEFANKLNLKAMLRYWLGRQEWSPFTLEPVEFAKLNFDFHPRAVRIWLGELGFRIEKVLTVSHFRMAVLKSTLPTSLLVFFDSVFQWTGSFFQWTPSVFVRAKLMDHELGMGEISNVQELIFKCPECGHAPLEENQIYLFCSTCHRKWGIKDGIYDFREPLP